MTRQSACVAVLLLAVIAQRFNFVHHRKGESSDLGIVLQGLQETGMLNHTAGQTRVRALFDSQKGSLEHVGVIGALMAAIGFDGMFAERIMSSNVRLAYSLVLSFGIFVATSSSMLATFLSLPFADNRIIAVAVKLHTMCTVPQLAVQVQLCLVMYAVLSDSEAKFFKGTWTYTVLEGVVLFLGCTCVAMHLCLREAAVELL